MTYREFTIKKKNGKTRRICAPSKKLLKAQRDALPELASYFFELEQQELGTDVFHGFIKNRNCVTAARKHIGKTVTKCYDISNCFDSVEYDYLPVPVKNQIPKIVATHTDGTLAQGFATSPILASIYLVKPIKDLQSILNVLFDSPVLTIYADDIQISLDTTDYTELNSLDEIVSSIFKTYSLSINKRKTHTRYAKFGNRRILGIQVGQDSLHPNRRLRKKIRAARHQGNGPSLGGLTTASRLLLPKVLR